MRGDYAIVASDEHHAVILGADGRIHGRIAVPNLEVFQSAVVASDVMVWASADGVRAWDLAKGAERWHVDEHGASLLVVGGEQVAVLHLKGVDTYELADGARRFHREGASATDGKWHDGTFVFADAGGEIEAVDEKTGKRRWTAKLADKVDSPAVILLGERALVFDGGRVRHEDGTVTFETGPYVELELASGEVDSRGQIAATVPGKFAPGSQTAIAYAPDGGTFVQAKPINGPPKIFRRDPVGRVLWSATGWPLQQVLYRESATPLHDGGGVQGLLLKPIGTDGVPSHVLVVFDGTTGKLHFGRSLGLHGELVHLTSGCAVVLDTDHGALSCLDDASGKTRWARPLTGRQPKAWGYQGDDDVMVLDGIPAVLQRVDATGRTLWQVELPDGAMPKPSDIGRAMVVLTTAHGLSVIDIATGKLTAVVQ